MESRPWAEFTAHALALYAPPLRRPSTRSKLKKIITDLGEICATTGDFSAASIAAWIRAHDDLRPATLRSYLGALSASITIGMEAGWFAADPFESRPAARIAY